MKKVVIISLAITGLISAIGIVILAITYGHRIPISMQEPVLNSLVTISSIVFGLMGVWLSVIYADSLKTIFDSELESVEKKESIKNFKYLSKPMIVAAIIIGYVLIFKFIKPVFYEIAIFHQYSSFLRGLSFFTLSILTLAQIWTIIYIFAPAENIRNKAEHQVESQARKERVSKNTTTIDSKD